MSAVRPSLLSRPLRGPRVDPFNLHSFGLTRGPGFYLVGTHIFPAAPVCGETYTLDSSAVGQFVFTAGEVLGFASSGQFPPGTTFTVSVRGDLGAGPTQVLDAV